MNENQAIFISPDIVIIDHDYQNYDRYDYTWDREAFLSDLAEEHNINDPEDASLYYSELTEKYPKEYEIWQGETDEWYKIPMMNALYYYPDCVSFQEADRYKTSGPITLLYDTELDRWALGMTGGGMDLAPHLLDNFIALGQGIPPNIANSIRRNYNAYVEEETHLANCDLLAEAMKKEAARWEERARQLAF